MSGCILSRFLVAGNVRDQRLADILRSDRWTDLVTAVPEPVRAGCTPDDSNDCAPANTIACDPAYDVAPPPAPSLGVPA